MMKKHLFLICLLIGVAASKYAAAQALADIKGSPLYYWGEGTGRTTAQADKAALAMLIGSIAVNVESSFSEQAQQISKDGKAEFTEYAHSMVQTHSSATLKNTEIMEWGEEPVHVLRYVKKSEVHKIFAERESKVKDFTEEAMRAEEKFQVANALRYYYWALMLLKSLPDAGKVSMNIADNQQKLDVFLPIKIRDVFDNLAFSVSGTQREDNLTHYTLGLTYKGQPAANCDYKFSGGQNWSYVVAAKDGKGTAEIVGDPASNKELRIRVEYTFENEWKVDNDVNDVLPKLEPITFKNSNLVVSLTEQPKAGKSGGGSATAVGQPTATAAVGQTTQGKTPQNGDAADIMKTVRTVDGSRYLSLLERVEAAIRSKNYEQARDCFTDDGYDIFTRLVAYGKAVIVAQPQYAFLEFEDGILARSLPMRFSFSNNRRVFVEDVVFNISQSEGKIRSLTFALPAHVCSDVWRHEKWNEYSKTAIINFIENYQTAYALKRLDYIESIFSDKALIIVGKVVKETASDRRFNIKKVETNTYTKAQYVQQLGQVFKSNEYVNLQFSNVSIKKAGRGGEIYGIQLKQDYFSASYGDTGYLFVMVDLNDAERPTIYVRTWQPEKDPDFGIYDVSNF
jgi:hypothetical protein